MGSRTRSYMPARALALLAAGLMLAGSPSVWADDDFFKSSPGPLAREHASLDSQAKCNDCHVDGSKALSNDKCLNCHDHNDLRARIRAGKGYHASSKVRGRKCETCHVEHKGRGFDIMGWRTVKGRSGKEGTAGFDHELAGWKLVDKHKVLECKECHKSVNKAGRRTYLGEDKLCGSCHKRDQPHGFDRRAMMACERCHTEVSWKPPRRRLKFDHNKKSDAEFPQEGTHRDVSCGKCHPQAKFNLKKRDPGNCANCHKSTHKGHLFDKKSCDWCHSPTFRSLRTFEFDHRARTRFKLSRTHGKLNCYQCHTKKLGTAKPARTCANCHAEDNPHRDRFKQFGRRSPRCEVCHPESSFKPSQFDHGKRTKFALTGKHATTACRSCHRGNKPYDFERFEAPPKLRCTGCHRHKDAHNGEFTDMPRRQKVMRNGKRVQTCLDCHTSGGSMKITRKGIKDVHGPRGKWPLTGGHRDVDCAKCHINNEYADTPTQCGVRCHEDSLHEGRLGDECSRCHEPGRWQAIFFDHTDDTEWPLNGLHRRVPTCDDCHPKRRYADTPSNCSAEGCHAKDDAHKGRLGSGCENCHLETGENIFDHNAQADFKLDGAHLTTKCSECHPKITFKPRPKDCYGGGACHDEPDIHRGVYGTACETCHSTATFKRIRPLHDVGNFSLKGSHDRLPCKRCHLDSRPLAGTGNFCINCHRQDDVHSNSLSPRCGECHNQWAFAPARFDHTTVGCNLTGLHRALPCYDCHKTGSFGGLSPNCYGCHADSARTTNRFDHTGQVACATCHNPNYWLPAQGNNAYGRESVCR